MTLRLSLDQLQAFQLVLETGSFSAAALRLGLSQPAVSLQVRELERRLGTRLIERVGRRLTPTAAGVSLLGHAGGILDAVEEATAAVHAHTEGVQGTVRLAAVATACIHLMPPVLKQIRQNYPLLRVVVTSGNTDDFIRRVEQNEVDLALVGLPVTSRALVATPVFHDAYVAIGPAEAPRLPKAVTPQDLAALPQVAYEPGAHTRQLVDGWLLAGGVKSRPEMELGSIEAMKEMVSVGLGYSVLPAMAVRAADRQTLQVRPVSPPLARELGVVMRADKPVTRGMRVVVDALLALQRQRPAQGLA